MTQQFHVIEGGLWTSVAEPPNAQLSRAVEIVADAFSVSCVQLHARTRGLARIARARQVAIYMAHVTLGFSLTALARHFGRDRTTITHACNVIEDARDERDFDELLNSLEKNCLVSCSLRKREALMKNKNRKSSRLAADLRAVQNVTLHDEAGDAVRVTMHVAESPLAWLRTRKDKDGAPMISDMQFAAGERLRADFTRAQLQPRITSSWDPTIAGCQRGLAHAPDFSSGTLAAKTRVTSALKEVGPELSGVLQDVCCFLKSMTQVESERRWPPRAGKIVLSLALDRLAAHYGFTAQATGCGHGMRQWGADDYKPQIVY